MLTIALSKGRILDDTLPLLAAAGIEPTESPEKSRKLIIPTTQDDVQLLIVRATDVPTYVEHGAADLGVAGKDVLMEYGGQGLYEPLDLQIAQCKLMTAGKVGAPEPKGRLRIATKFVNVAKRYYAEQGRQVDIIKLYGSMELAPLIGLADCVAAVVQGGASAATHEARSGWCMGERVAVALTYVPGEFPPAAVAASDNAPAASPAAAVSAARSAVAPTDPRMLSRNWS